MRYLLFLCFQILCFFSVTHAQVRGGEAENTSTTGRGKTHVILIGVSDYAFLSEDRQLNFADDDAILLKDYFRSQGIENIKLFLNDQAAKASEIGQEIENTLLVEAKSGDEVYIFFAGHGDIDNIYKDGYLLLNEVKPAATNSYKFNQALSLRGLQETIGIADQNGVQVKLIVDACRAGSVTSTNPHGMVSNLNTGLVKMVSCKANEFSEEDMKYGNGHGVFTFYLVQGLMGLANSNDDNIITMKELQRYVEDNVASARNDQQNPQFIIGNPQEQISTFDPQMLKKAQKEENLSLALNTLTKNKSAESAPIAMSNYCVALTQLFLEQTINGKFFTSELDSLDRQTIAFGNTNSKKSHDESVVQVVSSWNGKYYASLSSDGIRIYTNNDLKNPNVLTSIKGVPNCMEFAAYGAVLYAGVNHNSFVEYDLFGQKILQEVMVKDGVNTISVYKDSLLLIGTTKGGIYIHDISLNKGMTIKAHKGKVNALGINYPYIFSAGDDGKLIKTDLRIKKKSASVSAHSGSGLDMNILLDKKEILTLGSDGILKKWKMSDLSSCGQAKLEMKEVNCIETDPFEKICFVGGSEKKLMAVDLFAMQVTKTKSAGTSGVNSMDYDPKNYRIVMGEEDGSICVQQLKVNPDLPAALELYRQLRICDASPEMTAKLTGTLIVGLTNKVNEVLENLVNGDAEIPSNSKMESVIKYAQKAFELGNTQVKVNKKLEINLLMLEIYQILLYGERTQYATGMKKIERVLELDPDGAYVFNTAALLHMKFKELDKALEMISKAESMSEIWIEPTYNFGRILMERGDLLGAEQKFKQTVESVPDLAKGYSSLMDVYLIQKNYKEALLYAQKAKFFDTTKVVPDNLKKYAKLESERYKKVPSNRRDTLQIGDIMGGGIIAYIEPETYKCIIVFPYDLDQMMNWNQARQVCEDLSANGYSDWHLPTLTEFNNIAISYLSVPGFKAHFDESYWTSTTDKDGKNAFWVGDRGVAIDKSLKSNLRFVRPVRYF